MMLLFIQLWKMSSLIYLNSYHGLTVSELFLFKIGKLHCDCPMEYVYGLPYIHVLKVLKDITGECDPSHHNFSIVWWKSFCFHTWEHDHYNEDEKQLSKAFLSVRLNETT